MLRRKTGNRHAALTLTYFSSIAMHSAPSLLVGVINAGVIFGLSCITIAGAGHLFSKINKDINRKKLLEEIIKCENPFKMQ